MLLQISNVQLLHSVPRDIKRLQDRISLLLQELPGLRHGDAETQAIT